MTSDEELIAVQHAADRLAERFPDVARERIDELVRTRHAGYAGAHVRDFVPVLVEHDVRKDIIAGEL
ncbi:hypothetical protein [Leifsonia sp. NPDC080035]|uniref:Uncharacterized protein n=1 Tax=Leifsonia sp. NPDC080035 TaxID=3143936 RepID=A0AAU7G5A8_9MICO